MTTKIRDEVTEEDVDLPESILEYWMDWHEETTPADAEMLLYRDADGAIICECCGVNYNSDVDKD